jgi:16S rRNA processing protein RimM
VPAPAPGTDGLLEVGRIGKAHGLAGDVVVHLVSDRTERLDPGSVLQSDRGPLTVERARVQGKHHVVRFGGAADRSDAEALRGVVLYAEPLHDDEALFVHELVGAEVVDREGRVLGVVASLEANPASDLLVLEGGGLVPTRFILGFDRGRRVSVDIPDGLLD